jgi:hypothetical protein
VIYRTIEYYESEERSFFYSVRTRAFEFFKQGGFPGVVHSQYYNIRMTYTDIEGDKCIILDNVDLQVAMAMYDKKSLKIMCEPDD